MFEIQYERCKDCGKAVEYGRECGCTQPQLCPTFPLCCPKCKEIMELHEDYGLCRACAIFTTSDVNQAVSIPIYIPDQEEPKS